MNNRTIGWNVINGYVVSTVRLPIDHGFGRASLWYETMIFKATEDGKDVADWSELYCERYATEGEARAGHEHAKTLAEKGDVGQEEDA